MTTEAKGLDEARAALAEVDQMVAAHGWTVDDGVPSHHLRHALTVADTLAARLAEVEAELERARAVGPRWVWDPQIYKFVIGGVELARLASWRGGWLGYCDGRNGSYFDAAPSTCPSLPDAARAVCERLGLPVILDGLPEGGESC